VRLERTREPLSHRPGGDHQRVEAGRGHALAGPGQTKLVLLAREIGLQSVPRMIEPVLVQRGQAPVVDHGWTPAAAWSGGGARIGATSGITVLPGAAEERRIPSPPRRHPFVYLNPSGTLCLTASDFSASLASDSVMNWLIASLRSGLSLRTSIPRSDLLMMGPARIWMPAFFSISS